MPAPRCGSGFLWRGTAQPAAPGGFFSHSPGRSQAATERGGPRLGPGRAGWGRAGQGQERADGPRHGRGNASCAAPRVQAARPPPGRWRRVWRRSGGHAHRLNRAAPQRKRPSAATRTHREEAALSPGSPLLGRPRKHSRPGRAAPAQRVLRPRRTPAVCRWMPGGDRGRSVVPGVPVPGRGSRCRLRPPPPPPTLTSGAPPGVGSSLRGLLRAEQGQAIDVTAHRAGAGRAGYSAPWRSRSALRGPAGGALEHGLPDVRLAWGSAQTPSRFSCLWFCLPKAEIRRVKTPQFFLPGHSSWLGDDTPEQRVLMAG